MVLAVDNCQTCDLILLSSCMSRPSVVVGVVLAVGVNVFIDLSSVCVQSHQRANPCVITEASAVVSAATFT